MFSHVTVGTSDFDRSVAFYDAVLPVIGLQRRPVKPDGGPRSASWNAPGRPLPIFYVYEPFDGSRASAGNGQMTAFLAPSPEAVSAAHAAAMRCGGSDEGPPGPRDHYAIGYFGAYVRDPDGNKLHFVHRGDMECGG